MAFRRLTLGVLSLTAMLAWPAHAHAQNRGVYPLGMTATNAGVTPEPGFMYSNQLLFYSRDEAKDDEGEALPDTGRNGVILDMNSIAWASGRTILGGARYSAVATFPLAKNELTSDVRGPISGGGGFGDSYYLPFILGWNGRRASVRILYGFLAPTGRFVAGANDNVGSGYWTSTLSSGQTIQLTKDASLTASANVMYEFHTTQDGTGVHPGDNIDLDYSLTKTFPLGERSRLQVGVAGYEQRQTTATTNPSASPDAANDRYGVNAIGVVASVPFPSRRASLGVRAFKEFANRSTFQGFSFQIVGSIGL